MRVSELIGLECIQGTIVNGPFHLCRHEGIFDRLKGDHAWFHVLLRNGLGREIRRRRGRQWWILSELNLRRIDSGKAGRQERFPIRGCGTDRPRHFRTHRRFRRLQVGRGNRPRVDLLLFRNGSRRIVRSRTLANRLLGPCRLGG